MLSKMTKSENAKLVNKKKKSKQPEDILKPENILDTLLAQAKAEEKPLDKAEKYTLLLLAIAQYGKEGLADFIMIYKELHEVLKKLPDNSDKAWILGRTLSASGTLLELARDTVMSDEDVPAFNAVNEIRQISKSQLNKLLFQAEEEKTGKHPGDLSFQHRALALCHLANSEYKNIEIAKNAADALAKECTKSKNPDATLLANTVWAYVLIAQAAANNALDDSKMFGQASEMFDHARKMIKAISPGKSIFGNISTRKALVNSLTGTDDTDTYYPYWAVSIMTRASAQLGNPLDSHELFRYEGFFRRCDKTQQAVIKQFTKADDEDKLVALHCDVILGNKITAEANLIMSRKFTPEVKQALVAQIQAFARPM